jgi:hypothetical protein
MTEQLVNEAPAAPQFNYILPASASTTFRGTEFDFARVARYIEDLVRTTDRHVNLETEFAHFLTEAAEWAEASIRIVDEWPEA